MDEATASKEEKLAATVKAAKSRKTTALGLKPKAAAVASVNTEGPLAGLRGPVVTTYHEVHPLKSPASREHVTITMSKPPEGTTWFGVFDGERVVGCGAILVLGTNRYRFRAAWVRPEYRERGVGEAIIQARLDALPPGAGVEVISFAPDWFVEHGWAKTGENRYGGHIYSWTKP